MRKISLDYSRSHDFIKPTDLDRLQDQVLRCHEMLHHGTGLGCEFLGWLDLPHRFDQAEVKRIKATAERIRSQSQVFLVVGIGGSYLGARAVIDMLSHSFYNELSRERRKSPKIYYVGHNLSAAYVNDLLEIIDGQEICLNVISKSGTTTETALAFQLLKQYMEKKYGKEGARGRIYASTDRSKGALRRLAELEGYETFVVPDNIGGRYSVLTPVGLLPIAVAGIDIDQMLAGAQTAAGDLARDALSDNDCYQYAAIRHILYAQGKSTEILVNYDPRLIYFGEWFKQLFGESEGKQGQGIWPVSVSFTTDLHSLGQFIQDGPRNLFETVLKVEDPGRDIKIAWGDAPSFMGLDYLEGKSLGYINSQALEGVVAAHTGGGVPNLLIDIPELSPYYCGYLLYFFMKACAMSGYLSGVNPFDQPGVETYKRNMRQLLQS